MKLKNGEIFSVKCTVGGKNNLIPIGKLIYFELGCLTFRTNNPIARGVFKVVGNVRTTVVIIS